MLSRELEEVRNARHSAVVFHDFANNGGRNQSCDLGEVHRRFGLTGANEHSAIASAQRKNMAWPSEIRRPRLWVDCGQDRLSPIKGGDAGRNISLSFDGNAKGGAI